MPSAILFQSCRIGYLLLLGLLTLWWLVLDNSQYSLLFSLIGLLPLLLPLKGIWQGQPYTYAWASFILCLYLLQSLTLLYTTTDAFWFALIETALLLSLITGFSFYARIRGRELDLGLKKPN